MPKYLLSLLSLLFALSPNAHAETMLQIHGNYLYLLGTFDSGTAKSAIRLLNAHPEIHTLVFTANGGSVDDEGTLNLGRELRKRGINTHLIQDGVLASGGLSLFLAGERRSHDGPALIGVHAWQNCRSDDDGNADGQICRDATEFPPEDPAHALHADYTREMLGSQALYDFAISAAPSSSIHWMTPSEINRYGIFNAETSGPEDTPFGHLFEKERESVCGTCVIPHG